MQNKPSNAMLFGFGLGVLLIGGSIVSIKNVLCPAALSACTERYAAAVVFPQARTQAEPVSIREMQTRLGYDEWGLTENVAIEATPGGPYPLALDVHIAKGTTGTKDAEGRWNGPKGGVSFSWLPGIVGGTQAACLSYGVYLPDGFDFHYGGMLPGLSGGDNPRLGTMGFAARVMWRPQGGGDVIANVPIAGPGRSLSLVNGSFGFTRGRWTQIEQEVTLNTPGAADGTLAIWIDGRLAVRRKDITWRSSDQVRITGVVSDVHYEGLGNEGLAPRETTVRLSPLDLRWH